MNIRSALALSLSLLSSTALAAGTIKPGHVLGNSTGAERTPQDTPAISVIQQSGSGAGSGVGTALGVNVGSPGAPVVNGGALGTPSSGTLTNATGLPPTGLAVPSAVQTALGIAPNTTGGFITSSANLVFNVALPPFNASPSNSATANATAFQAAYTAAAAAVQGGRVSIPCGHYAINANLRTHVGAGKHVSTAGDGMDCVYLDFQGAVDGVTLLLDDGTASFDFRDLTCTTNTHGGQRCFDTELANGSGNTLGPASYFLDVSAYGTDVYNATTSTNSGTPSQDFWDNHWYEVGINNVTWLGGNCIGANQAAVTATGAQHTDCVVLQGSGVGGNTAPGAYSVAINFFGYITASCTSSIKENDFVQGVVNDNLGSTFCARGVYQSLASPVGFLTEIAQITGGQFYDTLYDVDIEDQQTASNTINGSQLAGPDPIALVKWEGTEGTITGSVFGCSLFTGSNGLSTAIKRTTSSITQGTVINGNTISGCGNGISEAASITSNDALENNHFIGNGYATLTGAASSTNLTVTGVTGSIGLDAGTVINGINVTAGSFVATQAYTITSVGTTNFTAIGASSNTVGVIFTATGVGAGTGTATLNGPQIVSQTSGTTGGDGVYVMNKSAAISAESLTAQWLASSPYDIIIGAGSASTLIHDGAFRLFSQLPPCNSTIAGSTLVVSNTTATAFNAPVTAGGGSNDTPVYCSFSQNEYVVR